MKLLQNLDCEMMCLIAAALFGSMLYIMLSTDGPALRKFRNMLTPEQLNMYNSITRERMTIFVQGLMIGVLTGFIYLNITKRGLFSACVFTVIVLVITILYYMLKPKKPSMLPHLESKEKRDQLMKVRESMKTKSVVGLLLGTISYLMIGLYL